MISHDKSRIIAYDSIGKKKAFTLKKRKRDYDAASTIISH